MSTKLPAVTAKRLALLDVEIDLAHGTLATIKARTDAIHNAVDPSNDPTAKDELERLTARRVQATGKLDALASMRNRADEWLKRVTTIEEVKTRLAPDLIAEPLTLKQSIEAQRAEIAAAKSELADIERAPTKIENLKGQVTAYVQSLARIGAPPTCLIEKDGLIKIDFSEAGHHKPAHCVFAFLAPDLMVERLVSEIKERQARTGRTPMSADEKRQRADELRAKLDKMERRDAALTTAALEAEVPGVTFRADTAIPALLGIRALREPARLVA
jgi:chromosome segregation ATPase